MLAWPARASLQVGLDVVLFVLAVMGGRVIPMFTSNGIPGVHAARHPVVEKLALGGVLALLAADVAAAAVRRSAPRWRWAPPSRTRRGSACGSRGGRCARRSSGCCTSPIVWIVVHLLLRGLAALGLVGELLAVHALTVGAIGGMTVGMMTRTARGHTGRPLVADGFEVACYVLVALAAAIRVFGGMLLPGAYVATVVVSGICWSAAFALYAVRYWPVLSRPRLDGKPG